MRALTFWERMREEAAKAAAAESADPWRLTLERVRGKVDFFDRLERVSSQTLWICSKSHNAAGRLARFETGKDYGRAWWAAVRVRDLTRGGYLEQVRGYCREPARRA